MKLNDRVLSDIGLSAALVHEALTRLGNGRHKVTQIKRAMKKPYSEAIIKRSIVQLVDRDFIQREGEMGDPRGYFYKLNNAHQKS